MKGQWVEKSFGEIVNIGNGQVDPRKEPYKDYFHIGPENVTSETGQISNLQTANELGLVSGKYLFDEEAIIYSKIRPNLNKVCLPDFSGICSADMYPIWVKNDVIAKHYLYLFMKSTLFMNPAIKASMRTGLPKINRHDLSKIKVTFPADIQEQTHIANLLMTWEKETETIEQLTDAKEKQFEWLSMQLLGGHKRLDTFNHAWQRTPFQSVFTQFKKLNAECVYYEVLSVTKDGIVSQSDYFNKDVASADKSKYLIVERGDLVMSGLNFWMGSIDFQNIRDIGIVSPAYKTFKITGTSFDHDFLRFYVRSKLMTRILIGSSVQGASIVRRNLDMDMLNNSVLHLPDLEEQKAIANVLLTAEKEIDLLKKLAEAYKLQKRGLMQKLLTGEWRVDRQKAS